PSRLRRRQHGPPQPGVGAAGQDGDAEQANGQAQVVALQRGGRLRGGRSPGGGLLAQGGKGFRPPQPPYLPPDQAEHGDQAQYDAAEDQETDGPIKTDADEDLDDAEKDYQPQQQRRQESRRSGLALVQQ